MGLELKRHPDEELDANERGRRKRLGRTTALTAGEDKKKEDLHRSQVDTHKNAWVHFSQTLMPVLNMATRQS